MEGFWHVAPFPNVKTPSLLMKTLNKSIRNAQIAALPWRYVREGLADSLPAQDTLNAKQPNRYQPALNARKKIVMESYWREGQKKEESFIPVQDILNANSHYGLNRFQGNALHVDTVLWSKNQP